MNEFRHYIVSIREGLRTAPLIHTEKWQGIDITKHPEMATHEVKHVFIHAPMPTEDLDYYRDQIKPSLPWADRHFKLDRSSGEPLNPGHTWHEWPYGHSANKFRDHMGQFNHTYAERYWPRWAGLYPNGNVPDMVADRGWHHTGIRYRYGDLMDVILQLVREPLTRQAILPVWFPEDTGVVHGSRVPCSIYYQFLVRNNRLDIVYALRSCDFVRHFRDDLYLTVRLALWVIEECRNKSEEWKTIVPGEFVAMITSMHMFRNDWIKEFGHVEKEEQRRAK